MGAGVVGILLGPEVTGVAGCLGFGPASVVRRWSWVAARCRGWCGVRVLVESCIVDASIFVVKLLRAYGGCLGTRSR